MTPTPTSDPLTAVLVANVSHGALALAANGGFTYTPTRLQRAGQLYLQGQRRDGDSNTVTVSLTVTASGSALAGQWLANEGSGSTLVDSSGSGNNGGLQGNPTWVTGQHGQAIRFDGSGDYAVVPDASSLDISGAITMAAWVRPEKLATQYLVKKATNGGTNGYELSLSSAGKVFVRFNQLTSGDTFRVNSTSSYPTNGTTWMHVAATYDGTTMKVYVNGVEEGSLAGPASIVTNNLGLGIGAQPDGVSQLQGAMDDVHLYNRALSLAEIQALASTSNGSSAENDFNGDGKSDILWRNDATGDNYLWTMNGTSVASAAAVANAALAWKVAGSGDYNGDGKADVLWRNSSSGELYIWLMNGATISSSGAATTVADANWKIVGSGDYNGDGKSDILWRNDATGDNYLWTMNGTSVASAAAVANAALAWKVAGSGDYNGDGKADVLWRNSSSGELYIWLMNGATISSSGAATTVADANWKIVGSGDYNGDGKSDILWRNDATGDNYLWTMNGTSVASAAAVANAALAWKVAGSGDYNGDGKADVLWRNSSSGELYIWLMNGATISSSGAATTVADANWKIVPANPPTG